MADSAKQSSASQHIRTATVVPGTSHGSLASLASLAPHPAAVAPAEPVRVHQPKFLPISSSDQPPLLQQTQSPLPQRVSAAALQAPAPRIQPAFRSRINATPAALSAIVNSLSYWLIAILVGTAAWIIRNRNSRWNRIYVDPARPGEASNPVLPESPPTPSPRTATLNPASAGPDRHIAIAAMPATVEQAAGSATSGRFVAMDFPDPDTDAAPCDPVHHPLELDCQPTRFTLTLRHAALRYRLRLKNPGFEPLQALIIWADLVTAEAGIPPSRHIHFVPGALPPCHYLDGLPVGKTIVFDGELRLLLADMAKMRLGPAELLLPLMRISVESAGEAARGVSASACFAIGIQPAAAGAGIQPFRIDSGPGIWRSLGVQRLNTADSS